MQDPGSVSEQTLRRVVNLGVISVARVQGVDPEQRLGLRCECGSRGCTSAIEATAAERSDDGRPVVMVVPAHRDAVPGRVTEANERFVKIEIEPAA